MNSDMGPTSKQITQSLKQKKRNLMDKVFLQKINDGIAAFSLFLESIWEIDKKILAKYLKSKKTRELIDSYRDIINPRMMIIINKYSSLDNTDRRKSNNGKDQNQDQEFL